MRFTKLNKPDCEVNVNLSKYSIDWQKGGSRPHLKVKKFLETYWKFEQVFEEFRIPGSKLRVDILNVSSKVAVEISPKSSHSFNAFFHKSRAGGFLASLKRDQEKEKWILENGFKYVCLKDEDLKDLTKDRFSDKFKVPL